MAEVAHAPVKSAIQSKSSRAGLEFSTARVEKKLRKANFCKSVASASSIHLTAVVERVIQEVLANADKQADGVEGKIPSAKRITSQHVVAAARSDPDLARAFSGFCFTSYMSAPKAVDHILDAEAQKERKEQSAAAAAKKEKQKETEAALQD
tara:strand:- start:136 stop:591 length:456 start_codon:yes stop_codon:yes gene_type:complete